jgi:hypothetical protein
MTICLYADKTLYTDKAAVSFNHPFIFTEMNKLYISGNKSFAIALAGAPFVMDKTYLSEMAKLWWCLEMAEASNSAIAVNKDHLGSLLVNRQCIVITRNRVYHKNTSSQQLSPIDPDQPCAIGSGNRYAVIALLAGKTPLEAMRISSLTDSVSHLTEIDSIKMSDLNPLGTAKTTTVKTAKKTTVRKK